MKGKLNIKQHGDSAKYEFLSGLESRIREAVENMMWPTEPLDPERSVIICHSEPGAWNPPNYQVT